MTDIVVKERCVTEDTVENIVTLIKPKGCSEGTMRMSQDRHGEERYRNRKLRGNQFLFQQCGKRFWGNRPSLTGS